MFTAVVAVGATGVVAMPYSVYASAAATFVGQGHPLDPSFRS